MFENPRRGRQARNFTTNVPKILDLKSSSEQIFSENWRWVPLLFGGQLCFLYFVPKCFQPIYMKTAIKVKDEVTEVNNLGKKLDHAGVGPVNVLLWYIVTKCYLCSHTPNWRISARRYRPGVRKIIFLKRTQQFQVNLLINIFILISSVNPTLRLDRISTIAMLFGETVAWN